VEQGKAHRSGDEEDLGATRQFSSTRDLVEFARGGDTSAASLLLERLGPRLVLWVAARLSPKLRELFDPEDVVQEILLAVHEGLPELDDRGERAFFAWVFRIGDNRIRDLADYQGAAKRKARPPPRVSQTTPATAAMRSEALLRVRAAIERLPEDYRTVIQLRRIEERDTEEVAKEMGRSENAVRVLYCRALKELRNVIGVSDSSL
jgi:RNA polymerase sigma-70 factor (ECF subfamily)